jgi:hypothetical protein
MFLLLPVPGIEPGRVILRASFFVVFKITLRRMIKMHCALCQFQNLFSR